YNLPEQRVVVIPHGVNEEFFKLDRTKPDRSKQERYVLCVSTLHPHKNLGRLIRAYERSNRDFGLTLAGMRGFAAEGLERLVSELKLNDRVRITGWIAREEVLKLYANALAFVYPSSFEGFGMPVLEAMAAGIPTACADIPPLREVAAEAALFF